MGVLSKECRCVPEDLRAYHTGVSYWAGRTNINDCSIGIEIVNTGYNLHFIAPNLKHSSLDR